MDIDTVVVGAGPAGLTVAHHLHRSGVDCVVLDGHERVGDSWRRHYDGLRLFSPPRYASLPGVRVPTRGCPTRDEFADYLERYAAGLGVRVRTGVRVLRVERADAGFRLDTSDGEVVARNVVVATGAHARPVVPALADRLAPGLRQMHSSDYRGPEQLAPGGVLVVGAANSGTDIALEAAAAGHPVWLAGRHPGQVPVDIDSPLGRLATPVIMFVFRHVLTLRTPMGRRLRDASRGHGVNLVRNKLADLDAAGVVRVGRVTEVRDGRPVCADGERPDVATVVWCTGSTPDHEFLDLPVLDDDGRVVHDRGVATEPGLYFMGLEFQYALASATIQGFDRDARHVVRHLLARRHEPAVHRHSQTAPASGSS
jgi:putative flavoprotein involved in K+ transport